MFAVFVSFGDQRPNTANAEKKPADAPRLKTPEVYRYKMVPGDVVEISYRYTPEFNQTVTIQPDGFVVLEIVGEVKLSGRNLEQARQEIIKKASVRLNDPEVTLILKEFRQLADDKTLGNRLFFSDCRFADQCFANQRF